jgi:hypothetical protein
MWIDIQIKSCASIRVPQRNQPLHMSVLAHCHCPLQKEVPESAGSEGEVLFRNATSRRSLSLLALELALDLPSQTSCCKPSAMLSTTSIIQNFIQRQPCLGELGMVSTFWFYNGE